MDLTIDFLVEPYLNPFFLISQPSWYCFIEMSFHLCSVLGIDKRHLTEDVLVVWFHQQFFYSHDRVVDFRGWYQIMTPLTSLTIF